MDRGAWAQNLSGGLTVYWDRYGNGGLGSEFWGWFDRNLWLDGVGDTWGRDLSDDMTIP